jgi:hypothetical protein
MRTITCFDNIKRDFQQVVWDIDWIDLVQDRNRRQAVVYWVMNVKLYYEENFLTSWGPVSFSRRTVLYGVRYIVRNTLG